MSNPVYDADRAIAAAAQSATVQNTPVLHAASRAGNWWGGPGVIWFAALVWIGARALRRTRAALLGLRGLEAVLVGSAISSLTKVFAGRARPFVTPGEPDHWEFYHGWTDSHYFSFPSGHTMAAAAFAMAVWMLAPVWSKSSRWAMTSAALASVVVVGSARIYSNQHWFSDVVCGAVLGIATGFVLVRWHARHRDTAFDRVLLGRAVAENIS